MSHPPDDDRTVLSISGTAPPPNAHERGNALPAGTRLGEFEITGVLGEGGFGIVYCALDTSLERQVALKEYMPSFAWRATQAHVSVISSQNADSFEAGRRSFINEARLLAQFDHPSLVKVYRFWEANGTAYMVMPYYRGPTLKEALKARAEPPDEAWLRALLAPLLDALEVIHQHQCFHRDIAPDNILMLEEGRPLLLDFGAARRAIGDMNQAFTVILKQNYAPIEQYAEMPGMRQGAWTDLYALASVVHFAIAGEAPPQAVGRMLADPYVPLAARYADRYSRAFLEAIDRALAFRPEERPQSVAEMRALLGFDAAPREKTEARPAPAHAPAPAPASMAATTSASTPAASPAAATQRKGRSTMLLAGLGVAVLGAAGLFAYLQREAPPPVPDSTPAAATEAAPAPSAPPAPPAPASTPAVTPAFTPNGALDALLAGASPERKVSVEVPNTRLRIDRDRFSFSIRSSHPGHVYVYMVGTRGDDFHLLLPNAVDKDNRIRPGEVLSLPRAKWKFVASGPAGTDRFVVMVSDAPRDFGATGLGAGDPFPAFPLERAAALQRAHTGAAPLYAGVPSCASAPCPAAYGATAFTIDEVAN
ncbi:serine/threonine-protein kinase [Massilia sp. Leaf139]|uniref:serine/threonine-protein kinase n=1 Tax=Massilia sp. Leaf139 TaxID=1736272 RepID=UPI000A6B9D47|nr:serine/threonine-protein kinase [Massilia sp. Leaf139]